jgi:parallel beta-helix repeat protein
MKAIAPFIAAALSIASASAQAGTIRVKAGANAQERLQSALIDAKPGDTILIGKGRFVLTDGLSLDVPKVTIRGAGAGKTVLSFKGQQGAGEGLLVTSDDVVMRDFAVEDTKGDGIKAKGVKRVVFTRLRVEWTRGPNTANGAYGIYPVSSTDVLVDKVLVKGASDAGIYVGQSKNIIVRNSSASQNVAGIEIENSYNADVYGNTAIGNTGGILIFDLPNLPQQGGHSIRIFKNFVSKNDVPNFAAPGSTVSSVPTGTGIMVMATRNVHIFNNVLGNNATANVFVVAYKFPYKDANYDPLLKDIVVRDNTHGPAGWKPGFVGGEVLTAAMGGKTAPVFWDGVGGDAARVRVTDAVAVLTLGLEKPDSPMTQAAPRVIDLSKTVAAAEPAAIVLPAAMEAATR